MHNWRLLLFGFFVILQISESFSERIVHGQREYCDQRSNIQGSFTYGNRISKPELRHSNIKNWRQSPKLHENLTLDPIRVNQRNISPLKNQLDQIHSRTIVTREWNAERKIYDGMLPITTWSPRESRVTFDRKVREDPILYANPITGFESERNIRKVRDSRQRLTTREEKNSQSSSPVREIRTSEKVEIEREQRSIRVADRVSRETSRRFIGTRIVETVSTRRNLLQKEPTTDRRIEIIFHATRTKDERDYRQSRVRIARNFNQRYIPNLTTRKDAERDRRAIRESDLRSIRHNRNDNEERRILEGRSLNALMRQNFNERDVTKRATSSDARVSRVAQNTDNGRTQEIRWEIRMNERRGEPNEVRRTLERRISDHTRDRTSSNALMRQNFNKRDATKSAADLDIRVSRVTQNNDDGRTQEIRREIRMKEERRTLERLISDQTRDRTTSNALMRHNFIERDVTKRATSLDARVLKVTQNVDDGRTQVRREIRMNERRGEPNERRALERRISENTRDRTSLNALMRQNFNERDATKRATSSDARVSRVTRNIDDRRTQEIRREIRMNERRGEPNEARRTLERRISTSDNRDRTSSNALMRQNFNDQDATRDTGSDTRVSRITRNIDNGRTQVKREIRINENRKEYFNRRDAGFSVDGRNDHREINNNLDTLENKEIYSYVFTNWQKYVLYAVQGMYLFGIFTQTFGSKGNKISRSPWSAILTRPAIKVD